MKKHLYAVGVVLVGIVAVNAGNLLRQKIDDGNANFAIPEASRENGTEAKPDWVSREPQPEIPLSSYFDQLCELLMKVYVDPVKDDHKFVEGAIKGMVASLNDPNCTYMEPKAFQSFMNARSGKFEGIGADLVFELSAEDRARTGTLASRSMAAEEVTDVIQIPRLVVAWVVPGGPADKAGVRAGDWVDSVDGRWVMNSDILKQLRALQLKVQSGKAQNTELTALRKKLRDESKNSLVPGRALERLSMGTSGSLKVKWNRGNKSFETNITRQSSSCPLFSVGTDGVIRLQFLSGQAEELKNAIRGKQQVTIDLRGNVIGDLKAVRECIGVVAPAGTYGYLVRDRGVKNAPLKVLTGNTHPPKLTLLVDSRTRNAAEIFALALSSRGKAKLSGQAMADDRSVTEVIELPDKAGYTLVTAKYVAQATATAKKVSK
jgi:carboxyl-terminal processing protease